MPGRRVEVVREVMCNIPKGGGGWSLVGEYPGSTNVKNNAMAANIAQEDQAIKKQKLDGGRSRRILNVNTRVLLHKSKPDPGCGTNVFASHKEQAAYISTAEMIKKFQSSTRDIELSQNKAASHESRTSMMQMRPRLKLTRPKEPEFQTAARVRAVRIKSSAELEEEMLAKIPKFRGRALNKKILEAPTLPSLPRSSPKPPEFKNHNLQCRLTEPRPPQLETSLRARPLKIKSFQELEIEELEKLPKFKARPLNKKILESKGDLGLFCNKKAQITTPQEFHFATDERLGPPLADRGFEKERQFSVQLLQKQLEEEKARIPEANPYPYTTDYPTMPPKPEPKQCTRPEGLFKGWRV
ncbi:uncharacterized protein A4U43_C03F11450 [Asparagus officinalis]|uniref:TPX2 central domain-containing protein n=1 Tax=Asparagus officinalis TaxID=4686 RepID=A0A5P1F956_ASPOF|nr:uncharacterized protein A4U43_C03F11450 [Asparagus officinalis]